MTINFSIDRNVTFKETFEFLKEIGLLSLPEEKLIFDGDKTVSFCLEVGKSDIGEKLKYIPKENLYCSILSDKGITLFTVAGSNISVFIPMNNVLSIMRKE